MTTDATIGEGLTIRAVGPAIASGRIPLSELARIASGLQATLERIAMSVVGVGALRSGGRRPTEIADAVKLDFVGFSAGSAVLELQRTGIEHANDGDLLGESFAILSAGISDIRDTGGLSSPLLGKHFSPQVINGLVTLCGGIGNRNVHRIEFSSLGHSWFTLDREVQGGLRRIQKSTSEEELSIVGRLHMGDFEPLSLRCRIDTHTGSVWCDFDDDLRDAVFGRLDELVIASGNAELQSDRVTVRILHLSDIRTVQTAKMKTLDELAMEQGVTPVEGIDAFRGESIDDFATFIDLIRSARG